VGELEPVVVAAKRLTPSMVLTIPRQHVLAFIAQEGGLTSHATILARALGVPMVFGVDVNRELDCGTHVIVSGGEGRVYVDPDDETNCYFNKKLESLRRKRMVCEVEQAEVIAQRRSGERVKVKLNISTPDELENINIMPHDGIGLLRTEFLFMDRSNPPTEDEQYAMYRRILGQVPDKPVTIRLLDISTDKLPPYFTLPEGVNPDLELRGEMAVETFPETYIKQLKALLRANEWGNMRLLYPMVSDVSDLTTFRTTLAAARTACRKEKQQCFDKNIKEGVMIETPSAAMLVDELLANVDFLSIGSNDLLQYTLAASRGNMLAEKRYHILHPSLLRLIELIAKAGRKAGKEVTLCGEIASFEEYYPLLLEAGVRTFSVSVNKFSDIKCELYHLARHGHQKDLKRYYTLRSKTEADRFIARYL
jgi:phosphotransferase system enzyme I (PtsI)